MKEPLDGDISLADVLSKFRTVRATVWQERALVLRCLAVSTAIGMIIALGTHDEFNASTQILPYGSKGAASGLSGLAGLAGVRLPAGIGEQFIAPDVFPKIAKTTDFLVAVLETPLFFGSTGAQKTPNEYFRNTFTPTAIERLVKLPGNLLAALRGPASSPVVLADKTVADSLRRYDDEYLQLLENIGERLQVDITDKKTLVIRVSGTMPDAYAAADLVRNAARLLTKRVVDLEAHKSGEQLRFIENQYANVLQRYEAAQKRLAVFADRNRTLGGAVSLIEREHLQREQDLAFEVLQQLSRELEQARIKKSQDTPVFAVIEQVVVPAKRSSPKRALVLMFSEMCGLLVAGALVVYRVNIPRKIGSIE